MIAKYDIVTSGNTAESGNWTIITPYDAEIDPGLIRVRYDLKENEEMAKGTRQLYNVFVVDPEGDGKVIFEKMRVIATGEEAAKMKTVHDPACKLQKDLDDYDFIVEDVGDWGSIRPKV